MAQLSGHQPLLSIFLGVLALTKSTLASAVQASRYTACQTLAGEHPLAQCPKGTLFVSATDKRANFTTVQDAVRSLPNDTSAQTILVGAGRYTEQVNVTRPGPLTLLGEIAKDERRPYADIKMGDQVQNRVQLWWNSANVNLSRFSDNVFTGVLTVGPSLEATRTGHGPLVDADPSMGCSDFKAYNIDFRNEYEQWSVGPSLAYTVAHANASFYSCGFYSWQDTIFVGRLANVYMHDAIIAGQTDYIYGFGTLWIEASTLVSRSCHYVTAMKGANTTFANKYGAYISNSRFISSNATVLNGAQKCALGRPWNDAHRSVVMNSYLDAQILPQGYAPWDNQPAGNVGPNTTMAVYKTFGPGSNPAAVLAGRVTRNLTEEQWKPYSTPTKVFMTPQGVQPNVAWIDPLVLDDFDSEGDGK
ncbi:hypothetical protein MCOR07_003859 [Pyricularia oryzae]|nr:hypothetical protein MCOR01_010137 [Pyricularia oryzae]KAI6337596.1 hypothetical protein MCOR30_003392 [Pyricularia oryzae]KAI6360673.1 hypothetical protein MCOR32_008896 [Pyricularia oryzae]KAI6406887.1 hypothetical protein MCOR23_002063 [Pyricularia oryzae]KAI6465253.1 hypothetical protein MCOR15_003433 [Pyricularia oryzae]